MSRNKDKLPSQSAEGSSDVDAFLRAVASAPKPSVGAGQRGRLIFAMDATASREPTWDRACHLQAEMFEATAALGGLDVQLVFYRGFRECKTTAFLSDSRALADRMVRVRCLGGKTQIGRVLSHAISTTKKDKVNAMVFVGDAFEEEVDSVCHKAGELGLLGVPVFMFHERGDPVAGRVFQQIARLSGGAYSPFDMSSAKQLKDLLGAVAVYAAGGHKALADYGRKQGGAALQLTHQVGKT